MEMESRTTEEAVKLSGGGCLRVCGGWRRTTASGKEERALKRDGILTTHFCRSVGPGAEIQGMEMDREGEKVRCYERHASWVSPP
jgi:hypothetical protein